MGIAVARDLGQEHWAAIVPPVDEMNIARLERSWERRQREHYDSIAEDYEAHYSDPFSQHYRDRFINPYLTQGIELRGKKVLEAMCGAGPTTGHLLSKGAQVTGLDISPRCIELFRKAHPECATLCTSIFETNLPAQSFDVVVVVGGLHHLHPRTNDAIAEIHRILKPAGYFCFVEPHRGSFPNLVRNIWYSCDPLFEDNERSIDMSQLQIDNEQQFEFMKTTFHGNIAYLFVFNSMVLRIPLGLKPLFSPALLHLEAVLERLLCRRTTSCFVVAQWRKR